MAKKTITPRNEDLYVSLMNQVRGIEIKGATMPYTSFNGNMFSYLKDGDVALRLGEKEREEFIKKFKTSLFQTYGITQKEYVTIPAALLKKYKDLKPYVIKSFEYVKTLKAKPTTRSKK
jgi:TfoX/Sxy family transcriptional regulator of competence genes